MEQSGGANCINEMKFEEYEQWNTLTDEEKATIKEAESIIAYFYRPGWQNFSKEMLLASEHGGF